MNKYERESTAKISRVLRAARKCLGRTQQDMAQVIGVSQSAISKMESETLVPSVTHWYMLCKELRIDPKETFDSGYIDNEIAIGNSPSYPESSFRLPRMYSKNRKSKVREILPCILFFEKELGTAAFDKFCGRKEVDPDFFAVLDNEIGFRFVVELVDFLVEKKVLNASSLSAVAAPVNQPNAHGMIHRKYDLAGDGEQLLKSFVAHSDHYGAYFRSQIVFSKGKRIDLAICPTEHLSEADCAETTLHALLCRYRSAYLERFLTYGGHLHSASVVEKECRYKNGADHCLYRIELAS